MSILFVAMGLVFTAIGVLRDDASASEAIFLVGGVLTCGIAAILVELGRWRRM